MQDQTAELSWRAGDVPVSETFDDPYFSLENGLAETQHVFLRGNDLPARFRDGFHVAELGFGTGLNFLATLQAWEASGQTGCLRYTSFEAFPMTPADMTKALTAFSGQGLRIQDLTHVWRAEGGVFRFAPGVTLEVQIGDARRQVAAWTGQADAWFLDGFSPTKNPELWEPALMQHVARTTRPGGHFATYTAAGAVRRGLQDAGFSVERVPGFGRKRHMTRGVLA